MPFHIGSGCLPQPPSVTVAFIVAVRSGYPLKMSSPENSEFFAQRTRLKRWSALSDLSPAGRNDVREDVINRFELLRTPAYAGWGGKHSFRPSNGEITSVFPDEDSQEILSVTPG